MDAITVGSKVRYAEVLEPGDETARFIITEDNGDRLLARLVCDWTIPPVKLLRRAEIVKADD